MTRAAEAGHRPYIYDHVFLGEGHERNERRTWFVIVLCGAMMVIEIVGGLLFGSIALVADGLHMSTHAGALLLAALAYTYSRRLAHDRRFSFGTGKLGDLAGFTSAVVLAMIALLIGWEAATRLFAPVPIHFGQAIPIAVLGLLVNIVSAWLLSAGGHDHGHSHGHGHGHGHAHGHGHGHSHGHAHAHAHDGGDAHEEAQEFALGAGIGRLLIHEAGVPPRFRLAVTGIALPAAEAASLVTDRGGGRVERFTFRRTGELLESVEVIPEPHAFAVRLALDDGAGRHDVALTFAEADGGAADDAAGNHHRDNNMRAAVVHVLADAAVSVLVIAGLVLARLFGWLWMDPVAGVIGAVVIASWSYTLIRDTGAILLDMTPDARLAARMRTIVEGEGDDVRDLHLWRLGPGHLGAIVSIGARSGLSAEAYRARLERLPAISHLTVEVMRAAA